MTQYQTGTVAKVTVQGEEVLGVARDGEWVVFGHSFFKSLGQDNAIFVTDVRPLVVLDLDGLRAEDIVYALQSNEGEGFKVIADQIASQTKPPRIPEPGLWGVVEAQTNFPTRRWVHHEEDRWVSDMGTVLHWDDLIDPVLVREGLS